jgi:chromosome partitioning protein
MLILAITINKGGVGKTTLTKHIATAATDAGLNVMVLDMDTQQNATNWAKRRKAKHDRDLPVVKFITENDLPDEIKKAEQAGCDLLLIDTPPGRSSEAPAAVEAADFVLMPFWLEADAHAGVEKSAGLARRMGKPAIAILNFATPNSRSHEEAARNVMAALGVPMAPVVLHRYELYRLANPEGLTVQEMEPGSRAADEIAELWNWISAGLQVSTGAIVHNGEAA